jgi:hypothetical protein
MKIELAKPRFEVRNITSLGGGVTSPYAKPPMAPVFVVHFGEGRFTLDEAEALELHAQLSVWVDGLPDLKRRIEETIR